MKHENLIQLIKNQFKLMVNEGNSKITEHKAIVG